MEWSSHPKGDSQMEGSRRLRFQRGPSSCHSQSQRRSSKTLWLCVFIRCRTGGSRRGRHCTYTLGKALIRGIIALLVIFKPSAKLTLYFWSFFPFWIMYIFNNKRDGKIKARKALHLHTRKSAYSRYYCLTSFLSPLQNWLFIFEVNHNSYRFWESCTYPST